MSAEAQVRTPGASSHETELKKSLGLRDLVLAQVLFIMGLGWVGVAAKLGHSHVVFWLLAVSLFYLPSAAVVIYLNRRMPMEGGLYQWTKFGFGGFAGFMVAWNLWVYAIVLNSEIGVNAVSMLAYSLGPQGHWMLENRLVLTLATVVMVTAATAVTVRGFSLGRWIQNAGGVILMTVFLLLIALPFRNLALGRIASYNPLQLELPSFTLESLNILGKMCFGALGGFEFMAIFAGECKDGGRAIGRSVLVAAPLVTILFILGTSAVLTSTGGAEIDLVSPISQALTLGARPTDPGYALIPLILFGVLAIRLAQFSLTFAGTARLPMVAGWDNLLPAWFTRLHPKWGTPVESTLFVGVITLATGLLGNAGVGRQEGFQLLTNLSGILYAVAYLVLFALPLFGRTGVAREAPWWLKAAAVSGWLMTALFVVFAAFPIINVPNPLFFGSKILGTFVLANLAGAWIFLSNQARTRRQG